MIDQYKIFFFLTLFVHPLFFNDGTVLSLFYHLFKIKVIKNPLLLQTYPDDFKLLAILV